MQWSKKKTEKDDDANIACYQTEWKATNERWQQYYLQRYQCFSISYATLLQSLG